MRVWRVVAWELGLVILLLPQAFVLFYFFPFLFVGGNALGLLKAVFLYALSISWVSAPFLALLTLLVRLLVVARVRWFLTLTFCLGAGYLWLAAWNLLVLNAFAYGRAALPILLCSVGTAGYAQARAFYLESLPSPKPDPDETKNEEAKNQAEGLSE